MSGRILPGLGQPQLLPAICPRVTPKLVEQLQLAPELLRR